MKIHNILLVLTLSIVAVAAETYNEIYAEGSKEYKSKKYKEAASSFEKAAKQAKTANEKYNSMRYQGYSLRHIRKYSEAAKVFENLIMVEKLSEKQKNNSLGEYAYNAFSAKEYPKLFTVTNKIIADDNVDIKTKTTCVNLSCLASGDLKKYKDMEKWATKICELNPQGQWHSRGLLYQAKALRRQNKFEDALKLLNKDAIAKMHPNRQGEAYIERGYLQSSMNKHEEAVAEFATVYELPKGYFRHKEMSIVFAIEELNSIDYLKATEIWIERVDIIKNKYWKTRSLICIAQILQKQGKLEEAKKKWEECKKSGSQYKKLADRKIAIIDQKLKAK